ncbi:uncharacterized protein TNCV_3606081 [Trichonephila clavipes]|uniref:Uncharacterized protein n=1 Tax=Trichonephila clavipes TaxID=2585209 RepID=A0A8X6RM78_TRICX|nr:uncharacterized protein TNCV_3606081 [Trichonephila clavipes]
MGRRLLDLKSETGRKKLSDGKCKPGFDARSAKYPPSTHGGNNRIVMTQRTRLDDFLRATIIGRLKWGLTQLEVSEDLGIAQSVISRFFQRFQDDGNSDSRRTFIWRATGTRYHQENTIERHRFGGVKLLFWGGEKNSVLEN